MRMELEEVAEVERNEQLFFSELKVGFNVAVRLLVNLSSRHELTPYESTCLKEVLDTSEKLDQLS